MYRGKFRNRSICLFQLESIWSGKCSVLFFSRPRSEGWPHHGRTLSISLCPLSFWLTLPRRVLSTSWGCPSRPYVVFLACVDLEFVPCIISFSRQLPCFLTVRAVFDEGVGGLNPPPAKISDPPAAIRKTQGGRLSMYLCISTVVDFNSQNFDPPNEISQIQPCSRCEAKDNRQRVVSHTQISMIECGSSVV